MLVGLGFLLLIHSVFNGGFTFSARILWLPLALVIFGFTAFFHRDFERITRNRWKAWMIAALFYPLSILISWPYVMAVNAFFPAGRTITFHGPVIRKWESSGRSKSYLIVILDQSSGEEVTLQTSEAKYRQVSEGDGIGETFSVGLFGIPFRWRFQKLT